MPEDHSLFNEFPPVSTEEWEKVIKKDLRGADYKDTLRWHTGEGISILPFYRSENIDPNRPLFSDKHDWEIRQAIDESDINKANKVARNAIKGGANALTFRLGVSLVENSLGINVHGTAIKNQKDFSHLLKGIDLQKTNLHFNTRMASPVLLAMLLHEIEEQRLESSDISGSFMFDPYSFIITHGRLPNQENAFIDQAKQMVVFCDANLAHTKSLGIDARIYHHAGGTMVQELGYALATGSEYLATLTETDLDADMIAQAIHFNFAIGSNYFLEIAKFRAIRKLWQHVLEAYGVKGKQAYIHGSSSAWNKTSYDPYINMLRTTTEGMSAAMAGCDAITIHPFDETFQEPDDFSQRIARNSQIILKEEAYLNKVSDAAAGSYYVEELTETFAEAAWTCFQEIEQQGGMLKAIKSGYVQTSVEASRNKRNHDIETRKRIFVGTNQYPKMGESTNGIITKDHTVTSLKTTDKTCDIEAKNLIKSLEMALKKACSLGDIMPALVNLSKENISTITLYKGAEAFEELRRATQKHDHTPLVLNLPLGNKKMRKARSAFALNFLGCAGYKVVDPIGFESMNEAIDQIKKNDPDIVVLCSSNKEYHTLVPELCEAVKSMQNNPIIVLAGYPKNEIAHYKEAGVDIFIHAQCNVLKTLKDVHKRLKIIKNDE